MNEHVQAVQLEEKVIDILVNVNNETPKDVLGKINELCDIKNDQILWMISRNLYHVSYSNPKLVWILSDLALEIKNSLSDDLKIKFSDALYIPIVSFIIMGEERCPSLCSAESLYFYGILAMKGVVSIAPRLRIIREQFAELTFMRHLIYNSLIPMLGSCSHIIRIECPEFFDEIMEYFKYSNQIIANEIQRSLELPPLSFPSPAQLSLKNVAGMPYLSDDAKLHVALSADDVDFLRVFMDERKIDPSHRLEPSTVSPSECLNNRAPLICAAAFYGALKCFKFLFLSKADLLACDESDDPLGLTQYATIGGSLEIFRLCNNEVGHSRECLNSAISYWRDDIAHWIIENDEARLDEVIPGETSVFICAASTNNIKFVRFLLEQGVPFWTPEYAESEDSSPMELACQWDCLSIVIMMCTMAEVPKELFERGIWSGVESNSIPVVMFMMEKFKSFITPALIASLLETARLNHLPQMIALLDGQSEKSL